MSKIQLTLSKDEAIVLFEFLARFSDTDVLSIEDQAEERVLWDLNCILERSLVEPLTTEWPKLVAMARERVRDSTD